MRISVAIRSLWALRTGSIYEHHEPRDRREVIEAEQLRAHDGEQVEEPATDEAVYDAEDQDGGVRVCKRPNKYLRKSAEEEGGEEHVDGAEPVSHAAGENLGNLGD